MNPTKPFMAACLFLCLLAVGVSVSLTYAETGQPTHYQAHGRCYNCGSVVDYAVPWGIPVKDHEDAVGCPKCGCTNYTPPDGRGMLRDPDAEPDDRDKAGNR